MKKIRRIAAMAAAMAITACMAAPAFNFTADAAKVAINSEDKATHEYRAYRIFKGTYDADLGLTITGFGEGINSAGLLADTSFTGLVITPADNTDPDNPVPAVTVGDFLGTKTDAASVAQAIEKLNYASGSDEANNLADIISQHLDNTTGYTIVSTNSAEPTTIPAGYWLITDTYDPTDDEDANLKPDAVSKYILKVNDISNETIEISTKKDVPSVVKKVKENRDVSDYEYLVGTTNVKDNDYNDVADYNIGDAVPFKLYGTMPSNYDVYKSYFYEFTDTLGTQFTAPANTAVKVYAVNPDSEDADTEADVTEITSSATVTVEGHTIKITLADAKAINAITKDTVITVEYEAVLNNTAVIGLNGQENKVDLTYSNNPNQGGEGERDKTPEDKVIVFTYEQDIKKVDKATGATLADAQFNLYKKVTEDVEGTPTEVTYYVQVDADNKVTGWTTAQNAASALTTGEDGICKVIGLDDGTYYLTETKAPGGYNAIEGEMTLDIDATTYDSQTWNGTPSEALTGITLTASGDDAITDISESLPTTIRDKNGTVMAKIDNEKGVKLPETGGMGTTLFVLGGGVTVALAGIYLISKKRTTDAE